MTPGQKRGLILFVAAAVIVAVVAGFGWLREHSQVRPTASTSTVPIGGPFALLDENAQAVTDQTYRGKWLLVFFGFTHCPDVCPTALNDMALVLDQLGAQGDAIQPLFISVDPERDTPQFLKDYTDAFHPRIVGLTGTPEQISATAKTYRIYYKKVPQGDTYTMDHSAIIYLMGPDGKFAAHFTHQTGVDRIVEKLRTLIP